MKRLLPLMLIAAFGMVACGKDESAAPEAAKIAAASTSPEAAMQAQVEALRAGQFSSAFLASIPPSMIDQVRAKWTAKMAEPASEEDRAQFQEMITELTADGAEDSIYAKIEPDLLKFKESAAMQMPMYVGMGRGILAAGVQQREDLSADQKAQAMASIDAFAKNMFFLMKTNHFDLFEEAAKFRAMRRIWATMTCDLVCGTWIVAAWLVGIPPLWKS